MSRVWPSPCCRLRIWSRTVNMYIDGWNYRNHHKLHCRLSVFSVLSLVMSLARRTADLLYCDIGNVSAQRKKEIGCPLTVHSELLSVIFSPSILLAHVLPYPTHLHRQPISFVSLTPLCTCMFAQYECQNECFVSSNISDAQKTFLPMSRSEILCLAITQAKQKKG